MDKFRSQQIAGTLAIIALTAGTALYVDGSLSGQPVQVSLVLQSQSQKPGKEGRILHEPQDPKKSGELVRHRHIDAYGVERKTEIDFADRSKASIEYSVFAKPFRVVDTKADGTSQIYQLDPMGKSLLQVEKTRADGSLHSRIKPGPDNSMERTFFKADGKTPACTQRIKADGSMTSMIYMPDGKSILATYNLEPEAPGQGEDQNQNQDQFDGYQSVQARRAVLQVSDKEGKLLSEETITRQGCHECGSEDCGNFEESISIKYFRPDGSGKIWFTQEWQSYPGDSNGSLQSAIEYLTDGKKKLSLTPCYEKLSEKEAAYLRIDKYGADGKTETSLFLDSERRLLLEKDSQGNSKSPADKGKVLGLEILTGPSYKSLPAEFFDPSPEPMRLQQILSN